eukprot:gene16439-biopygen2244
MMSGKPYFSKQPVASGWLHVVSRGDAGSREAHRETQQSCLSTAQQQPASSASGWNAFPAQYAAASGGDGR